MIDIYIPLTGKNTHSKAIDHARNNQHGNILNRTHQGRPDDPNDAGNEERIPPTEPVADEGGKDGAQQGAAGHAGSDSTLQHGIRIVEVGFVLDRSGLDIYLFLWDNNFLLTCFVPMMADMLDTSNPWIKPPMVASPVMRWTLENLGIFPIVPVSHQIE